MSSFIKAMYSCGVEFDRDNKKKYVGQCDPEVKHLKSLVITKEFKITRLVVRLRINASYFFIRLFNIQLDV